MERIEKINEFLKTNPKDNFLRHALALEYIKIGDVLKARILFEEIDNLFVENNIDELAEVI